LDKLQSHRESPRDIFSRNCTSLKNELYKLRASYFIYLFTKPKAALLEHKVKKERKRKE
jgi:hypothetical protein